MGNFYYFDVTAYESPDSDETCRENGIVYADNYIQAVKRLEEDYTSSDVDENTDYISDIVKINSLFSIPQNDFANSIILSDLFNELKEYFDKIPQTNKSGGDCDEKAHSEPI